MSFFDLGKTKLDDKPAVKRWKEGKYVGTVAASETRVSKTGQKMIELRLKFEDQQGYFFHSLNLTHPKAIPITQKTIAQILTYGYTNPPVRLETEEDVAMALRGAPVSVTIKPKEDSEQGYPRYGVFFNTLPDGGKVPFEDRAAASRSPSGIDY